MINILSAKNLNKIYKRGIENVHALQEASIDIKKCIAMSKGISTEQF